MSHHKNTIEGDPVDSPYPDCLCRTQVQVMRKFRFVSMAMLYFAGIHAQANDVYWVCDSGSWDDQACWSGLVFDLPVYFDHAHLSAADDIDRVISYQNPSTPVSVLGNLESLTVDSTGAGQITLLQHQDLLHTGYAETVGYSGRGQYIQNGGTNLADGLSLGEQTGSHGVYELNDGHLDVFSELIGVSGAGYMHQNGGTH